MLNQSPKSTRFNLFGSRINTRSRKIAATAVAVAVIGTGSAAYAAESAGVPTASPRVMADGNNCVVAYGQGNAHIGVSMVAAGTNKMNFAAWSPDRNYMRVLEIQVNSATNPFRGDPRLPKYVQLSSGSLRGNSATRRVGFVQLAPPSNGATYRNGFGAGSITVKYTYRTGKMVWVSRSRREVPFQIPEWRETSMELPLVVRIANNQIASYSLPPGTSTDIGSGVVHTDGVSRLNAGSARGILACRISSRSTLRAGA